MQDAHLHTRTLILLKDKNKAAPGSSCLKLKPFKNNK